MHIDNIKEHPVKNYLKLPHDISSWLPWKLCVKFAEATSLFLQTSKQASEIRNPWNAERRPSYSQASVSLPHQSILTSSLLLKSWAAASDSLAVLLPALRHQRVATLSSSPSREPHCPELTVLQVLLLTADVDHGPRAQGMIPKECRTPNNITCFFFCIQKMRGGVCFWTTNDFKGDDTGELFSLGCWTQACPLRILQQMNCTIPLGKN